MGWLGNLGGYLAMEPGVMELCESSFPGVRGYRVYRRRGPAGISLRTDVGDLAYAAPLDGGGTYLPMYSDPAKRKLMKPEAQWEVEAA